MYQHPHSPLSKKLVVYHTTLSRQAYSGVWHSLELIDFPSFASLETHAKIVEALRETAVDHLVIFSSYFLKRCFVEDSVDLTCAQKNRVAKMHN
ncbi:hypothetical protein Scep_016488 [Stephania cephalantha]|uniref:Uncharacterized protein n=1 Tax=Stephania cephalantha TaxID=152367 RepID=A0AAP0INJ9_9MAGN